MDTDTGSILRIVLRIICVIGALAMIAGVFMVWIDVDFKILFISSTQSYTGMDVIDQMQGRPIYEHAPLYALVGGAIAIIAVAVRFLTDKFRWIGIVAIPIIGAVIVAIMISFGNAVENADLGETKLFIFTIDLNKFTSMSVGSGAKSTLAGGAVLLVGGAANAIVEFLCQPHSRKMSRFFSFS